jgi:hypothetical protein
MFPKLFILYISLACIAKRSYQSADLKLSLEDLQEKILLDHRDQKCFSSNFTVTSIKYIPPKELLKNMESMNENAFIILWSSYEKYRFSWPKVNLIKELNEKRFVIMIENYESYLGEIVLKELLSTNSKDSKDVKEGLLFQAMSLYQGRFRSIWMRIAGKTKRFDDLKLTFLVCQKVIDFGIYNVLEYLFGMIVKYLEKEPKNYELIYSYKIHFRELLDLLSADEKENFGLKWVADQIDPYLIIAYFFYQKYPLSFHSTFIQKIKCRKEDPLYTFDVVLGVLKEKVKHQFDVIEGELTFNPDFKSPFPHIIEDDELVMIIRKIISKLMKFCNNHNKGFN